MRRSRRELWVLIALAILGALYRPLGVAILVVWMFLLLAYLVTLVIEWVVRR